MKRTRYLWELLCYGAGIMSCLYFASLVATLGVGYTFNYFWLSLGIGCIAVAKWGYLLRKLPKWIQTAVFLIMLVGGAIFLTVEGFIIAGAFDQPEQEAAYVIVLGAKVNGTIPSKRLQERIDAAVEYAKEHPDVQIIASGGQGADEGISEAAAICNSLVQQGIERERILLEDQSTSTEQNLINSKKLVSSADVKVVVATSDFHVFRAVSVAKEAGYTSVSGLPAPATSHHFLSPSYYVREFFGVINEFILKKI